VSLLFSYLSLLFGSTPLKVRMAEQKAELKAMQDLLKRQDHDLVRAFNTPHLCELCPSVLFGRGQGQRQSFLVDTPYAAFLTSADCLLKMSNL
jgi:hypothetical protein